MVPRHVTELFIEFIIHSLDLFYILSSEVNKLLNFSYLQICSTFICVKVKRETGQRQKSVEKFSLSSANSTASLFPPTPSLTLLKKQSVI